VASVKDVPKCPVFGGKGWNGMSIWKHAYFKYISQLCVTAIDWK
jgi:hypothetical protein